MLPEVRPLYWHWTIHYVSAIKRVWKLRASIQKSRLTLFWFQVCGQWALSMDGLVGSCWLLVVSGIFHDLCPVCVCVCPLVVSYSLWPYGLEPTRLLYPWNFQARILEWVAISFSRVSSWPKARTQVSHIAGKFFTVCVTRDAWPVCASHVLMFWLHFD